MINPLVPDVILLSQGDDEIVHYVNLKKKGIIFCLLFYPNEKFVYLKENSVMP